jgi:subtilase family serine protease
MNPGTPIVGITMYFRPTAEQKAELDALVQAQQTPGSPEYHQWLTPAEYAGLFGLSSSDVAKVAAWLTSQGFNVERVGNSRTSITFSGTAAQVENAFHTEMQEYVVDGEKHFSNATDLSVPAALGGVVLSVRNLDDFRPRPQVRYHTAGADSARPGFTAAQTDQHFLTPDDVATIYDITPAYNLGDTGSGVTIAVVGQSAINVADIENFQKAMGFTVKDPTVILVPASGTSAVSPGDESESDLDLEYSGGVGRGASIDFVYVGNAANYSVFDSLQYAIDNDTAPVISMSYGACEPTLSAGNFTTLEGILEQGVSQGQSVIAAAGDDGSTSCYGETSLSSAEQQELAVNYPASSAFATGLGGTEFPAADVAASNSTYWKQSSGNDVISSALSYIPEQVWNDDSAAIAAQYGAQYAISAGGGGVSTTIKRPSWQTGVSGLASGSFRLVPDISLDSSADDAGYLYCTSDTSAWSTGQKTSCNSGFRDASTQDLTVAGGTSFAAPIFAGMLSIINQKTSSSGEGVAAS